MPQFVLNIGDDTGEAWLAAQDEFTRGYVEAMFFTSAGPDDELDAAAVSDMAPETLAAIMLDCATFQAQNADDITEACDNGRINGYDMAAAGRDYWYSRNGHGVGYFDRELGAVGDKLDMAAHDACESCLYRGDDGLLYLD